jgi:hypothetical protein
VRQYQQGVHKRCLTSSGWLIATCVMLATPVFGSNDNNNPNPGVHPSNSKPYGYSYGDWSAKWWQWLLSIPSATNPNTDTTGADCSQGQSGQVWFLAGTFGAPAQRMCTVPTGKSLLIPILNAVFGAGVGDCLTPQPYNPGPCDVPSLRAGAAAWMDGPQTLELRVDGVSLSDLKQYRAQSPVFVYTLPQGNILNFLGLPDPAGTYGPAVSDGYWVMLTPLTPGSHSIYAKGTTNFGFTAEITYQVFVQQGH